MATLAIVCRLAGFPHWLWTVLYVFALGLAKGSIRLAFSFVFQPVASLPVVLPTLGLWDGIQAFG